MQIAWLINTFCFNSTLVQLKAEVQRHTTERLFSFNSTLVQLKDLSPRSLKTHLQSFNSTLVQLKVLRRRCGTPTPLVSILP